MESSLSPARRASLWPTAMNASMQPGQLNTTAYRSIFISDTHLGTRGCRADTLADFLKSVSCQNLFLVGDIIDGWRLRRSWCASSCGTPAAAPRLCTFPATTTK